MKVSVEMLVGRASTLTGGLTKVAFSELAKARLWPPLLVEAVAQSSATPVFNAKAWLFLVRWRRPER